MRVKFYETLYRAFIIWHWSGCILLLSICRDIPKETVMT